MRLDIELSVVDRSDLALGVDYVRLTAAQKAEHVRFDVDLLAHNVILITHKAHLCICWFDWVSPFQEIAIADTANADTGISKRCELIVKCFNLLGARGRIVCTKEEDDSLLARNAKFLQGFHRELCAFR